MTMPAPIHVMLPAQHRVAKAIKRQNGREATAIKYGVVDTINTTSPPTVSVYIDGNTTTATPCQFLANYVPTVGDNVMVALIGSDHRVRQQWVALGVPANTNPQNPLATGRAYLESANLTVSASVQGLTMNYDSYLTGGMALDGGLLVVPAAGPYLVTGQLSAAGVSSANWLRTYIMHTSGETVTYSYGNGYYAPASTELDSTVTDLIQCHAGDTLELGYRVNAATTANVPTNGQTCYLAAVQQPVNYI